MSRGILIHHVFRAQCLDDGSSYFGTISSENPEFGLDGNIPLNFGRKLQEKIAKHGRHRFSVKIWYTSAIREDVIKKLKEILSQTANHPLSLNVSDEERGEAITESLLGRIYDSAHRAAISIGLMGTKNPLGNVVTEETKEKMAAAKRGKVKWIHNLKTNEELQMRIGDDLPTGFKFGRLKKADRARAAKKTGVDPTSPTDDRFVKLPKFAQEAYAKQKLKEQQK